MANDTTVTTRRDFLKIASTATLASMFTWRRTVRAASPVWSTIPDQTWTVGQPVYLDLADYVTDPDGDSLIFSLDVALPQGVTLNGSVISGTPEAPMAARSYVASANDTGLPAPTNLTVE
jgi:hypothetical protein